MFCVLFRPRSFTKRLREDGAAFPTERWSINADTGELPLSRVISKPFARSILSSYAPVV